MDHETRVSLLDPESDIPLARQAQLVDISRSSIYYKPLVNEADLAAMRTIDIEFTKCPLPLNKLTAEFPNHIWGTDITYIRLAHGFCYLVAIIARHVG